MTPLRYDDIRPGDILVADGGFTCLDDGQICEVRSDGGGLFVLCHGPEDNLTDCAEHHYLDGQCDAGDIVIGFCRACKQVSA